MNQPADLARTDAIIEALRQGEWSTSDLVRISHAVARLGNNTTSILGQYGEELVAAAYLGTVQGFDQKAFDVRTPHDGDLQVKTYSTGKRPGVIRSFTHDVITVCVEPCTATVLAAKRYLAGDLYAAFKTLHETIYADKPWRWSGQQDDRFERGWSIPAGVPFKDVSWRFDRAGRG